MPVKLLFIGDVIGKPGREALSRELHRIVDRHMVDLVIANGENAAGGFGLTEETAQDMFKCGVQMITSGNHIWDKKDALEYIKREERIVRPANYPEGTPGRGTTIVKTPGGVKVGILNLEGRVFMNNLDCPFRCADREIAKLKEETPVILVDFHAEATSEKVSLGWYLDGRVSAVIGTHTHVQTADERILTAGTAYMTDAGMTGAFDSVIGVKKEEAILKFVSQRPSKFEVAKKDIRINAVAIEVDEMTGLALGIERINIACG
ncbi:2',3'-cyclic nucleotide 2'-phosphodiesterase [Citrifermentans bemidjiense Bem]|uniref:2',3'-cyclic nucleotide 2'-phosphodiesterase n=1 Tax=Citrifermentans bemidjiense (strain ATCC BAA-1014 / DSM 16622 / JCM 12645 / Bem) TaxID=404380 RepID=B5EFT6_CITBB|nr:TIGR00282 family metallophosphoesterase [Citrifermentans bemidjiense]ACH37990.1 2',3'-cyclic nucleotide 2'-phosphodiesterase [Citrifermentans bemidjiense Bem]